MLEHLLRCWFGHHPIGTLEEHVPAYHTPILFEQVWG